MKITCQSCQSKYTVSDEKVQGKTVKIKCRRCGTTILVNSAGVTSNGGIADPVSAASGPSDGSTFLVNVADGDQRSMTLAEIVSSYQASVINADTYVWADGMGDWQPLGQVDAIVAALHAGGGSTAAASEPAAAAQPSAAAAASSVHHGAGGEAVMAAAPRAAVRRDPGRPSHDLFSGGQGHEPQRPSNDDVATSAPLFSSSAAAGRRDENSMLFSLSALTAKAGSGSAATAPNPSGPPDDSGLIDLKALASGSSSAGSSSVASIVADDGGLFQLSAPIVTGAPAPAVVSAVEPAPKNRGPMVVVLGVLVAGIAIAGAFFFMQSGGTPPPAPAEPPPQAEAAVTPPAEPTPPPEPSATASATAAASAAAATAAPRPVGARPNPSRPTSGGAPTKAAAPAPAATAAPAAPKRGNCGCAPGDLMCAMQCSAKGK